MLEIQPPFIFSEALELFATIEGVERHFEAWYADIYPLVPVYDGEGKLLHLVHDREQKSANGLKLVVVDSGPQHVEDARRLLIDSLEFLHDKRAFREIPMSLNEKGLPALFAIALPFAWERKNF